LLPVTLLGERSITNGRIAVGPGTAGKSERSIGRVAATSGVAKEGKSAACGVVVADGVIKKRLKTAGRIIAASGVAYEGKRTIGSVLIPGRVVEKRGSANGCIFVCGIQRERTRADAGVKSSGRHGDERNPTKCRIEAAGRETSKSVLPFRGVATGVPAIGCRDNRSR
jgi:hypothetical protein